jgi:hypothetical protein
MAVTSSTLSSGASIAASSSLVAPPTITRADLSPIRTNTGPIEDTRGITGLRFPSDVGKYYMSMSINTYKRSAIDAASFGGFGNAKGLLNQTGSVILPLPQNLVDNNSTSFSEDSMGDIAGGAVDALASVAGFAADYGTKGIASELINFNKAADKVAKIGYAAAGVTTNKFMTVVLQGPQYKKHSFSWKLYPKNAAESVELNRIIWLLKNSMRTKLSGQNFYFDFPKVFQLKFSPNENFLYAFKPAVMESISVNYTPSGSPNFYGKTGAPDGVTLTMGFWELEYWLSENAQMSDLAKATGEGYEDAKYVLGHTGNPLLAAGAFAYGATHKAITDVASAAGTAVYNWWEGN